MDSPSQIERRFRSDVPLSPLTTLGLGGDAKRFLSARSTDELLAGFDWAKASGESVFVLGGGSNLVVADDGFSGLVIQVGWTGRTYQPTGERVRLTAAAGESWDEVVKETVEKELAGFECLAGIPGLVGATPIQNVGAYGQDVSDTITSVEVFDRTLGQVRRLNNEECGFAYRDSWLKQNPNRCVVLAVEYDLLESGEPTVAYAELEKYLVQTHSQRSLTAVRSAVIHLRRRKGMVLDNNDPDTKSAGSFFTNPIVSRSTAEQVVERAVMAGICSEASLLPQYPQADGRVKLAAGWLIERSGTRKGERSGNVGISSKHALALVHHGGGSTRELLDFARVVRDRVEETFGISLAVEPNLLGCKI